MIDIQLVRDHPEIIKAVCTHKNATIGDAEIDALLKSDTERRKLLEQIDSLRQERNEVAAESKTSKPTDKQVKRGKELKDQLSKREVELKKVEEQYYGILLQIPNLPTEDVPLGKSEEDNVVVYKVGEPTTFDFEPRNHWQIAEAKGWIDKERAAKVAGARFAYLKGPLVRLQWALQNFVTDILTNEDTLKLIAARAKLEVSTKPFTPVLPPLMIRTEVFAAMDRLEPREDRYKIEGQELWLQGSAEHVLGSMHMNEILPESELPLRYAGFATSFREEAGSYGKDMEGILRMHQFDKLEMESLTTAEDSLKEHLFMVAIQEYLMQQLELPYQVLQKCTADIGKPNARGIDIEVWLPGQNKYRETHTADYMTDYQARRLQTRVKRANGTELVHTNDATAFAAGRLMIAIIENNQQADGCVSVPKALHSYFGSKGL